MHYRNFKQIKTVRKTMNGRNDIYINYVFEY